MTRVPGKVGAPLGQPSVEGSSETAWRFSLVRVPINRGGYDRSGTYWWIGKPLFRYEAVEGEGSGEWPEGHLRATDREAAKAELQEHYPLAWFFR